MYKLGSNSYFSESAYTLSNATARYWGQTNAEKLAQIKDKYDPVNYLQCHNCIRSLDQSPFTTYTQVVTSGGSAASNLLISFIFVALTSISMLLF